MRDIELSDEVQEVSQDEECRIQEDESFFKACDKASGEDSLTKEDVREFFRMLERSTIKCERMLMNAEDAADLGIVNRCSDCGKPLVNSHPSSLHIHTVDECNAHAVRTVTES